MRRIIAFACAGIFSLSLVTAGEPTKADQKWLTAIEKMVANGDTRISTPSGERVNLLKDWAGKNGYNAAVKKIEAGYRIELSKSLARN